MPQGNPETGLRNGGRPIPSSKGSMAAAAAAATSISRSPSLTRHSNDISKPLSSSPSKTGLMQDNTTSFAAKAAAAGMHLKRSATTSLPPQHTETRRQQSSIDKSSQQPQSSPNPSKLSSSFRSQAVPVGATTPRPDYPARGRTHPSDPGGETGTTSNAPSFAASAAHKSFLHARLSSPPSVVISSPGSPPCDTGKFRTANNSLSSMAAAGAAASSISLPISASDNESLRDVSFHPDTIQSLTDKHPRSVNATAAASKTLSNGSQLKSTSPAREKFGNPGAKAAAVAANKLQESMKAERDYRDAVYHEEMRAKQMDTLLKTNGFAASQDVDHHQPEPIFASSLRQKTRSPVSSIHSCGDLSLAEEKSSSSQESQPDLLHAVSAPQPQVILPAPRTLQHHSLRKPSVKPNTAQNMLRKSHDIASAERERIRTINEVENREAEHTPLFTPLPRREVTKEELRNMGMPSRRVSSESAATGVPHEQSSSISAAQRSWQAVHNNPFESDKLDDPSLPIPRTITGNKGRLFALVGKPRVKNPQPYHHANRHRGSDDEQESKKRRHIHLLPRRRRRSSVASRGSRNMRLMLSLGDDTEAVDGDASSDEYGESPVSTSFKAARHTTDRPPVFKTTMRKEEKKTFNADKPWKHHEIGPGVTDEERKRYEGIWAANRGLYFEVDPQFNTRLQKEISLEEKKRDSDKKEDENEDKDQASPVKTSMDESTISEPLYDDGADESSSSDTSSIVDSDTNSDLVSEKDHSESEPRKEAETGSEGNDTKRAHFAESDQSVASLEKPHDNPGQPRHFKVNDPVQSTSAISLGPSSTNHLANGSREKQWASETNIPSTKTTTSVASDEAQVLANRAKEIGEAAYEAGKEQVSEMRGDQNPYPGPGKGGLNGIQKYSECVHPLVVRSIWRRSRLSDGVLRHIWDLVDRGRKGYLTREEFILGMWFVDQCLYGRKLPSRVDARAWSSVGRLAGVKIKDLHELRKKNQTKKALRKAEIRQIKDLKKKNKSKNKKIALEVASQA